MSFRAEFYNLFNRHTYNINGCGGNKSLIQTPGPTDNFGEIFGVNDGPRNGQLQSGSSSRTIAAEGREVTREVTWGRLRNRATGHGLSSYPVIIEKL
jgi:hypothetical protein